MFRSQKIFFPVLFLMLLLSSCTKEEGEGGRAQIVGRIMTQNYPNTETGAPYGELYPTPEHRVYIIYGDNEYHDDDVRTGGDGKFRFAGLQKGKYTVYTISERYRNVANPSGFVIESRTVMIKEKDETVDIGDIEIRRYRF
jgi:hypothetical protein